MAERRARADLAEALFQGAVLVPSGAGTLALFGWWALAGFAAGWVMPDLLRYVRIRRSA